MFADEDMAVKNYNKFKIGIIVSNISFLKKSSFSDVYFILDEI